MCYSFKIQNVLLLLISFFCLALTQTQECFNPNLTRIYPEETHFDLPKNGIDITIEMVNDDNELIVLDYGNPLYDEIQCVQNETLLKKIIDIEGKIKCSYTCDYPEGKTIINVNFDNETLKQYTIGNEIIEQDREPYIENSNILPEEEFHELPSSNQFIIEIELRNEANEPIKLMENDPLLDKIECILNETVAITKYINSNKNIVCSYVTIFPKSQSYIDVNYNGSNIKKYAIGRKVGEMDPSKIIIKNLCEVYYGISPDNIHEAGTDIYHDMLFFDYYGNPIYNSTLYALIDKIDCSSTNGIGIVDKHDRSGSLRCYSRDNKIIGSYVIRTKLKKDDGSLKLLMSDYYDIVPDSKLGNSTEVAFPPVLFYGGLNTVRVIKYRDPYGNDNTDVISKPMKIQYLIGTNGYATISTIIPNSNYEYQFFFNHANPGTRVKIRIARYWPGDYYVDSDWIPVTSF